MTRTIRKRKGLFSILGASALAVASTTAAGEKPSPVTIVSPVPIPISGNVGVSGTPTVQIGNTSPVPVSGTVGIAGTPTVTIQNSATAPLYVSDPAAATRTPFKLPMVLSFTASALSSDVNRLTVPDVTRIEVESIYCDFTAFSINNGISQVTGQPIVPTWEVRFCRGPSNRPNPSVQYCHMFIAQGVLFEPSGVYHGAISQNARFTLDAGEELVTGMERNYRESSDKVSYCNLNGYSESR